MIQVLVVDDHTATRIGIKFFIEEDPNIRVIAEARTGEEGIELYTSLNPDIVLIDIHLSKMSGIEAVKTIVSKQANAKIIVLTGSASKKEIQDSLSAGAKGYCLKDMDYSFLISAIKSVARGETWIDSSILKTFPEQLELIDGRIN